MVYEVQIRHCQPQIQKNGVHSYNMVYDMFHNPNCSLQRPSTKLPEVDIKSHSFFLSLVKDGPPDNLSLI